MIGTYIVAESTARKVGCNLRNILKRTNCSHTGIQACSLSHNFNKHPDLLGTACRKSRDELCHIASVIAVTLLRCWVGISVTHSTVTRRKYDRDASGS